MILRHQIPVRSPLTISALLAGLIPRQSSLATVRDRVRDEYGGGPVRLTASGTVALALAFRGSAGATERPRIALPAWGCYDLMTAADAVDAEVILYDLEPSRLAPQSNSLFQALAAKPHAVVAVHWFGVPLDLSTIRDQTNRQGIVLIDDAAQASGSLVGSRRAGGMGDLGILSFGRGKGRTGGSGGALVATSDRGVELMDRLSPVEDSGSGWASYLSLWAQWFLGRPLLYGLPRSVAALRLGQTIYRAPPAVRGISSRSAEVLKQVWETSASEAETRAARARRWKDLLQNRAGIQLIDLEPDARPGWLRFPVLASGDTLGSLTSHRADAAGIVRGYPLTMADLPVSSGRIRGSSGEFHGARTLANTLITLPTHSWVDDRDFSSVESLLV